jgi:ADP-heptose:LPS heptosyltransferase
LKPQAVEPQRAPCAGIPARQPRILIVRLSAIGDTALTLPLLFALRQRLPGAHIGWAVGERAAPLLRGLPQLNRLHVQPAGRHPLAGLRALARDIAAQDYQAALDPQGITRSALVPFLARIPRRIGFAPGPLESRELAPLLLNRQVALPREPGHLSLRTLALAAALDLPGLPWPRVALPRDPVAEARMAAWWQAQGLPEQTLVFGIGAGWPTRIWPVERLGTLVRAATDRGFACVVQWGPAERSRLPRWRTLLGAATHWAPATDLPDLLALLRLAAGYAGPDSAALHLAWLSGRPTFSWFGASDPARCAPFGPGHSHVARGPHHWRRTAWRGNPLADLTPEQVLPRFLAWLDALPAGPVYPDRIPIG